MTADSTPTLTLLLLGGGQGGGLRSQNKRASHLIKMRGPFGGVLSNKKPLPKEEAGCAVRSRSHLPEIVLPELAPKTTAAQAFSLLPTAPGCRGFIGPVPPPLWMSTMCWLWNWINNS